MGVQTDDGTGDPTLGGVSAHWDSGVTEFTGDSVINLSNAILDYGQPATKPNKWQST